MFVLRRLLPVLISLSVLPLTQLGAQDRLGILGDDLALGFLAQDAQQGLMNAWSDSASHPTDSPQVLWPSDRENTRGNLDWMIASLFKGLATSRFDAPHQGWGFLVGRSMGVDPASIAIAAEHGVKAAALPREVDRLLASNKILPETLLILFSQHDLCAADIDDITPSKDYKEALFSGITYALRRGEIPEKGVTIVLPHFLNLTSWLTSPSILQQPLNVLGETMSCQTARERAFQPTKSQGLMDLPQDTLMLKNIFPPNPVSKCPSLFAQQVLIRRKLSFFSQFNAKTRQQEIEKVQQEFLSVIADRIRNYRRAVDEVVGDLNDWLKRQKMDTKVFVKTIPETAYLEFSGADIAGDCWQLNAQGQNKLAQAVIQGVTKSGVVQ